MLSVRVRFSPLALSCAVLCFAACGKSHVRPGHADPDFDLAALRTGGLALEIDTAVSVTGFRRAFAAAFGSGDSLSSYLSARVLDSLNGGDPKIPARRAGSAANAPEEGEDAPRFLARITNIEIARATRELPTAILPGYGDNAMSPAGGGTSHSCTAAFDVEVREIATGGTRLSFSVTGRADVPLYAYKTALREAINAAARRTAWHLRGE